MKMKYSYHSERLNDEQNELVQAFYDLSMDFKAGKANDKEYLKKNAKFSEKIGEYCVKSSGNEWTGAEMLKNPQFTNYNTNFTTHFSTILSQAITPVVPALTSREYERLWDVVQVGWGDNAKYEVESNELFIVYDIAEGINRQNLQTTYNTEYTVSASKRQISTSVDWYKVASGKFDWGKMGVKIAQSFMVHLQLLVINAMTKCVANAADWGIAGYKKIGATDENWISLRQLVSAANNSDVYAIGTYDALAKITPHDAGFRFGPTDDLVTVGYLPSYKLVPMVELDQAILPGTINSAKPSLVIPNDYIYFIPMGFNKPVKVVYEGDNVLVNVDPLKTTDLTLGLTISMYVGADVIVGSKFGVLDVGS